MKNVLIVDDDLGFQRLLGISLKKYKKDFEVILSNNGEEAIGILNRKSIDLIVTDLQMPKIDGLTLLAYINDAFPKMPCVIMTAHSTPEIEKQFAQTGQRLLKKPFTINKLVEAVQAALAPKPPGGMLKGISVANFLQMIALEQKTCLLEITSTSNEKGFFYIENGEVFDAAFKGLNGEDAAYSLIALEGASISFTDIPSSQKVKKRIHSSLMGLIMEAMTRKDETVGNA
ncbi:MAG: response regulator [Candidatus Electrothrix sp. ATG1]|nr:response regulator [Candidatus Electrothrix sp. ATG1]